VEELHIKSTTNRIDRYWGREVKRQASAQMGFIVVLVVLLSPMSTPFAQVEYRPTADFTCREQQSCSELQISQRFQM